MGSRRLLLPLTLTLLTAGCLQLPSDTAATPDAVDRFVTVTLEGRNLNLTPQDPGGDRVLLPGSFLVDEDRKQVHVQRSSNGTRHNVTYWVQDGHRGVLVVPQHRSLRFTMGPGLGTFLVVSLDDGIRLHHLDVPHQVGNCTRSLEGAWGSQAPTAHDSWAGTWHLDDPLTVRYAWTGHAADEDRPLCPEGSMTWTMDPGWELVGRTEHP